MYWVLGSEKFSINDLHKFRLYCRFILLLFVLVSSYAVQHPEKVYRDFVFRFEAPHDRQYAL